MIDLMTVTKGYTHSTIFHADDVFSTAFLKLVNPAIEISRVLKVTDEMQADDCIVYDIGEGRYDHHQNDRLRRPIEDGYYFDKDGCMQMIPYCGFGLLWRDFGSLLCPSQKAWKKVDQTLVLPIDKTDNGIERNTLSAAVHAFNPAWNSTKTSDEAFWEAVEIAKQILRNYVDGANAENEAEEAVLNAKVVDDKILVLDKYMPWQDAVIEFMPEILYVVFPSARGGYNVQTVPDAPGSFNGRKLFPKKWLGNPDASLGMTFCHPGNFLLATETLDQAIHCAQLACAE